MTLLGTRKGTQRKSGIARRQKLLNAAQELLELHELDEISLGDVAAHADVPVGSAYHFYADIKDLYASLLAILEEELRTRLREPIRKPVCSWQDVVVVLIERGVAYFSKHPAASQLTIGPKAPADLKMRDRRHDASLAGIVADQIDKYFVLPQFPERNQVFFRAVEIADLMFCLSVFEHGRITKQMNKEAAIAMTAYLSHYLSAELPKRRGVNVPAERQRSASCGI